MNTQKRRRGNCDIKYYEIQQTVNSQLLNPKHLTHTSTE